MGPEQSEGVEVGEKTSADQLTNLLKNENFQGRFIRVQTHSQQEAINSVDKVLDQKVKAHANAEIEAEAANRLNLPIEDAKKLGRDWGIKLREVKSEQVGEQILENGKQKPLSREEQLTQKYKREEESKEGYVSEKAQALMDLKVAEDHQRQVLDKLIKDVELRKEDPSLLEAFDTWGLSPNSAGETGDDGRGYNSGVIHYFEYRADLAKNGRYKNDETPISIEGFINHSKKIKSLMENPNPSSNPDVQNAVVLKDNVGQQRLYLLTRSHEFIVGFKRVGEDSLKAITIMPGQDEKDLAKRVSDEKEGKGERRLNKLQSGIVELPLNLPTTKAA